MVYSAPDALPLELFGPPPHWPVLAAERWGPSVGDPAPGIIIDRPDHDRMRATSDSAARADPYAAAEREAIRAEPPDEDLSSLRAIIAGWSIPWRKRWGRRANELAEQGIRFPEDERRAFVEVLASIEAGAEPPPIDATSPVEPSAPVRWQCTNRFCLHKGRWWLSSQGVVNCLNCVPPAFPDLIVAQGDEADAPPCERSRSNQSVRSPDDLGSLRHV
ncbi:MAG: hypothetical protein ACM35G_07925 [Planctomycetaceae bacterium]